MSTKLEIGSKGEDLSVEFLQKQSYLILERNWYKGSDEADIICLTPSQDTLVIVEVKTSTKDNSIPSSWWVTPKKQRLMIELYKSYIKDHPEFKDYPFQFDVISVTLLPTRVRIKHIEKAITFKQRV